MAFPRLFLFLPLLALLAGCHTSNPWPKSYKLVRVTNPRGELIADWIAEGGVWQTERGYRFRAVQRTTGAPILLTARYPHGRKVEIGGPNIHVTRVAPPHWLVVHERKVIVREVREQNWK